MVNRSFWKDKSVLITGHTGFKGAWLTEWLLSLGAKIVGYSLQPNTQPSLFELLRHAERIDNNIGDINDAICFEWLLLDKQPDVIFHLAAQPLVHESYARPVYSFQTNLMGTVHLLNSLQKITKKCAAIFITTDKCYKNEEWCYGYRENDPLGGLDPYSASKACAEIAISSFRNSFFNPKSKMNIGIASTRAGNVIGGGDWAKDRIIPDCVRCLKYGQIIPIRNGFATRPWQHVLEPLCGYLMLAEKLYKEIEKEEQDRANLEKYATAFNFGPNISSNKSVYELVEEVIKHWPGTFKDVSSPFAKYEAFKLNLVSDKAFHFLGWRPIWDFATTVKKTIEWYRLEADNPAGLMQLTLDQINQYTSTLASITHELSIR